MVLGSVIVSRRRYFQFRPANNSNQFVFSKVPHRNEDKNLISVFINFEKANIIPKRFVSLLWLVKSNWAHDIAIFISGLGGMIMYWWRNI